MVDPIDGTSNFVRGLPLWVTSVAAVVDGEAVASANVAPALGDEFVADDDGVRRNDEAATVSDRRDPETFVVCPTLWWGRNDRESYARVCRGVVERFGDLRRYGSAQFTLSAVATGAVEGAVATVAGDPWDTVAGVHQIRAAGGVVTDLAGEPWRPGATGLAASNGEAHDAVLDAVREG